MKKPAGNSIDMRELYEIFAMKRAPDHTISRIETLEKKCMSMDLQINTL